MKKIPLVFITALFLISFELGGFRDYLISRTKSKTPPCVVFLNETDCLLNTTSSGMIELSMKVESQSEYNISSASFVIVEGGAGLDRAVGSITLYADDFDSDKTFLANYYVYKPGEVEIRGQIDLVRAADNSHCLIYSEPMTLKAFNPEESTKNASEADWKRKRESTKEIRETRGYEYYLCLTRTVEEVERKSCSDSLHVQQTALKTRFLHPVTLASGLI